MARRGALPGRCRVGAGRAGPGMALLLEHEFRPLPADKQIETLPFLEAVAHLPPFFGKSGTRGLRHLLDPIPDRTGTLPPTGTERLPTPAWTGPPCPVPGPQSGSHTPRVPSPRSPSAPPDPAPRSRPAPPPHRGTLPGGTGVASGPGVAPHPVRPAEQQRWETARPPPAVSRNGTGQNGAEPPRCTMRHCTPHGDSRARGEPRAVPR